MALPTLPTGELSWIFRPRNKDTCDFDFGTSPNVIDIANGRLGIGGKDGTYYLLNYLTNDPAHKVIRARNVVFGGSLGGFFGAAAFDGRQGEVRLDE